MKRYKLFLILLLFFGIANVAVGQTLSDPGFGISTFATPANQVTEIAINQTNGDIYFTGALTGNNSTAPMYKYDFSATLSTLGIDWTGTNWHTYMATDIEFYNDTIYSNLLGQIVSFDPISFVTAYPLSLTSDYETGSAIVGDYLWTTSGTVGDTYYKINLTTKTIEGTYPIGLTSNYEGLEYCETTDKLYILGDSYGLRELYMDGSGVSAAIGSLTGLYNFAIDPDGEYAYVLTGSDVLQINLQTGTTITFASGLNCNIYSDLEFGPSSVSAGYSLYIGGINIIYEVSSIGVFWTGTTDTDWFTATNWEGGVVPTFDDNVIVPTIPSGNPANFPIINGAGAECGGITIKDAASLTVNTGQSLNVASWFKNQSTNFTGDGEIILGNITSPTANFSGNITNLTIDNDAGARSSADVTIGGTLSLTNGTYTIAVGTLTLNNPIAGTEANLFASPSASLNLNGDGIDLPINITELFNLTFNNASGTVLQNDLTINNILALTSGDFVIGSHLLTINGMYNSTGGTLTGDATSDLYIGYTDTYTASGKYAKTIIGYKEVEADKLLLTTTKSANLSGSSYGATGNSTIKVPVYAAKDPAPTFILPGLILHNLTVDRTTGVDLAGNVILSGDFTLNNGTFNSSEFDVSVAGNFTNLDTYLQTDGTLEFNGNTNAELQTYGIGSGFGGKTESDLIYTYNYYGLYFDAYEDFLLKSIKVYALSAGDITIAWKDNAGTIIEQTTVAVPIGESRVDLNFNILAGTNLLLNLESGINLYYDYTGITYPYSLGNLGEITTSNVNIDHYMFFFDWEYEAEMQGNTDYNQITLNKDVANSINLQQDMQINGEFTLISGSATISDPTSQSGIYYNPGATLSYAGTETQTTDDIIFQWTVGMPTNILIANPAGVNLHADRGVEGELALEGNLFLGDYNFTMGTSSTVTGTPSNTAMVVAEGNGELRKMFDANGSFTFPVGDTTDVNEFTPLSLDFTAGTYAPGSYAAVNLSNIKHVDNSSANNFINRFWSVSQTGMTDFSCDFAMNYTDADVTGTETYMDGAKWNGATWDILNMDYDLNEISGTVTGFGDFSAISKLMQDFTVTVFDYNASLLEGATVDFDVLSQTTIADGTASFSVPVDATYDFSVTPNANCQAFYSESGVLIDASVTNIDVNLVIDDLESPTITCVDNQEFYLSNGQTVYTVSGTDFDPTATDDNCGIASVLNDFNGGATLAGAEFPIATTTVMWTITDNAGNETTCSFDVVIYAYNSVNNLNNRTISIYPNPTSTFVQVESSNFKIESIELTDITGRSLLKTKETKIDLSNQTNGVYMMIITTEKEVYTEKIMKK